MSRSKIACHQVIVIKSTRNIAGDISINGIRRIQQVMRDHSKQYLWLDVDWTICNFALFFFCVLLI